LGVPNKITHVRSFDLKSQIVAKRDATPSFSSISAWIFTWLFKFIQKGGKGALPFRDSDGNPGGVCSS
jgi:hypothetical protein